MSALTLGCFLSILKSIKYFYLTKMLRPYLKHSLKQLADLLAKGSKDRAVLRDLEAELQHRTTSGAKALARDIVRARDLLDRGVHRAEKAKIEEAEWRAIFTNGRIPGAGKAEIDGSVRSKGSSRLSPNGLNEGTLSVVNLKNTALDMNHDSSGRHVSTPQEINRLSGMYERLRQRLLDMSLRNPMLNFRASPTSKRQLQFVDEVPQQIYLKLVYEGATLDIDSLPEPESTPPEERTAEFKAALDHGKVSDQVYLEKIEALLAAEGDDDEVALVQLELELRDRIRAKLGMPPRPTRQSISPSDHARSLGLDPSPDLPLNSTAQRHRDNKLQSLKWPDVLDATLSKIGDDARTAEQEMGLSTLFLVFGFLEWYETEESARRLMAPLLLLPVRLDKRKSARGRTIYFLTATAESPETNLSLEKRIERDFNRNLPEFVADEDNSGSINEYLSAVSESIDGLRRWRVRPWLMLGHFGFGRLTMYADLGPDRWPATPVSNKLVEAILNGTEKSEAGGEFVPHSVDDYQTEDPEFEKVAPYLIHDADASQHSALIDALKGKHLVIHGPPGTGKSQTITNLIANAVAQGKRVLFLAEKLAALEVVKRRLDTAGLGEFCLEVHSDRVASARVVESLRSRHELGYSAPSQRSTDIEEQLRRSRSDLGAYLAALHNKRHDDRSVFDDIWASVRGETIHGEAFNSVRNVAFPKHLLEDDEELGQARYSLSLYSTVKRAYEDDFGPVQQSPLSVLKCGPSAHQGVYFSLKEKLENLVRPAGRLASLAQEAAQYGIEARVDAQAAMRVCDSLPSDIPTSEMVGRVSALAIDQFHRVSDNVTNLQKMQRSAEIALSLKGVSKEDLQAIFTLNGGVSGTRLWQLPVRDLHDESKRIVDWVERDAYLMDVVRPIMRVIDYDDVSWDELLAIDCTVRHLNEMSSEEIAWFAWTNKENETTISAACNEWGQLESERRSWARRFARCRRFPRAQELSEVASLLRKGGIARAIGALAGHKKRVNALMSDLGIPDGSTVEADELDKLSSFLSKLEVFENNREYAELFGDLWQGLGSPLDLIRSAVGARLTLRNKLAEMDAGLSLFEKIDLFSEQKLLHVGKLSVGAFEASQRDRNRFGNEKILAAVNNAKKEIEAARAILRVNLPNIEGESLTLKQLVEHAKREIAQRGAVGTLEALLSLGEQSYMLDDNEWVSSLKLAADWLIASNEHLRNPKLQKAFLSIRSEADLQKIFDLAANYVQGCEQIDACILEIANDCDIRGLDHYDPKTLCGVIADVLTRPDELRRHLSLKSQRHEVSKFDLDGLLDSLEELKVDPENYPAMLDAVAAWRRADRDRRVHGVLGRASGAGLEARRSEFITQDRKKISLDRKSVANLLIVRRPPNGSSVGPKKQWTEMALLQNEFGKEKRFVPVRDLVIRAGRAIQALKPCFLMSPLSLAKYVPAKTIEFDLLIVDEASQMRPEDVLGALLRTKQLVVVGDVKQLPPTDFFQRSDQSVIEDEEHEDVDDESVLEACQKTFKQVRMLRWHYRSRCESLTAFSNREFYKNGLITFPSATPNSFSIDLVRVNGDYKAGCNLQEAQRLAEEAIALMRH